MDAHLDTRLQVGVLRVFPGIFSLLFRGFWGCGEPLVKRCRPAPKGIGGHMQCGSGGVGECRIDT